MSSLRTATRWSALALLALALSARMDASAARGPQEPRPVGHELVAATLTGAGAELGAEELARRLAAHGAPAMPALLARLAEMHELGDATATGPRDRAALRLAFTHLRQREVVAFLASGPGDASDAARAESLLVLAEVATAKDLELLLALQDTAADDERMERALVQALTRLLEREPRLAPSIADRLHEFPPSRQHSVLTTLARTRTPDVPRTLAELLGRTEELEPLVLNELRRACREWREGVDEQVLASVRACLQAQDVALVAEAVGVAREQDDVEAVPQLVQLLAHSDAYVRDAAHGALQHLGGKRLPADARRWEEWRRAEQRAWSAEFPLWSKRLARGGPAEVVAAMRFLADEPLFRREALAELVPLLERVEVSVVTLACATLARMRAYEAIPELRECLAHDDRRVRDAALAALLRIEGKPSEPRVQD